MVWRRSVIGLCLLAVLAGCQGTQMTGEQKATAVGAAVGAGIGSSAGDGFVEIVGDSLVGGADRDLGGRRLEMDEFRNPRFGRTGSLR